MKPTEKTWTRRELADLDEPTFNAQTMALSEQLNMILAGQHPACIGFALTWALGEMISGYYEEDMRRKVLENHLQVLDDVIKGCVEEREREDLAGHPLIKGEATWLKCSC